MWAYFSMAFEQKTEGFEKKLQTENLQNGGVI